MVGRFGIALVLISLIHGFSHAQSVQEYSQGVNSVNNGLGTYGPGDNVGDYVKVHFDTWFANPLNAPWFAYAQVNVFGQTGTIVSSRTDTILTAPNQSVFFTASITANPAAIAGNTWLGGMYDVGQFIPGVGDVSQDQSFAFCWVRN